MNHIFDAVKDACPHNVVAIRSAFAVTIVSQYPYRHVQIVARLYNSPAGTAGGGAAGGVVVLCAGGGWIQLRAELCVLRARVCEGVFVWVRVTWVYGLFAWPPLLHPRGCAVQTSCPQPQAHIHCVHA